MSGRIKKDSRFRTIVREYGKVFVTWFGARFKQPEGSKLLVGAEVELLAGSTLSVALLRHKDTSLGLPDEVWHLKGIEGGEKQREKVTSDWAQIQAELGNPHPVLPTSTKVRVASKAEALVEKTAAGLDITVNGDVPDRRRSKQDKDIEDVRALAEQHNYLGIGQRLEVQFSKDDEAASFRMAMVRKGYKVADQIHDTDNGRRAVDVFINVKPR